MEILFAKIKILYNHNPLQKKKLKTPRGMTSPEVWLERKKFSLPQGREKATNPRYLGHATDGEGAPADAYYAATVSGPCISC